MCFATGYCLCEDLSMYIGELYPSREHDILPVVSLLFSSPPSLPTQWVVIKMVL